MPVRVFTNSFTTGCGNDTAPRIGLQSQADPRGAKKGAEREGFEPSVRLPVHRFSRPAQSTTLAPLPIPDRTRLPGQSDRRGLSRLTPVVTPNRREGRQVTPAGLQRAELTLPDPSLRWERLVQVYETLAFPESGRAAGETRSGPTHSPRLPGKR